MKALILLFALFSLVSYAGTPVETLVPVDGVYSPNGFDSNDNSEIIVEGWLPNLCHKTPMTKSEIKNGKIHITVTALRYDESSPFCPEMIVPFIQSVNVGILDKGIYEIVVNGKSPYQKNSKIKISESSSNALDDHIYANVHYVEKSHGTKTVTLNGYNPSDCLVLDEVKFVSNEVNTYSVLPIMKRVRDFCPMKMTPFAYDVEVPQSLNVNKVLLHVRGMDGNSVNSILHLEQ
ncbi:MAG: hypothetical protein ACJAS4_001146 [Bacteriovoracaceae bacterium]|jgi:hypothetical protein